MSTIANRIERLPEPSPEALDAAMRCGRRERARVASALAARAIQAVHRASGLALDALVHRLRAA